MLTLEELQEITLASFREGYGFTASPTPAAK